MKINKTLVSVGAVVVIVLSGITLVNVFGYHGHGHHGSGSSIGAGLVGGTIGGLVGGSIAASSSRSDSGVSTNDIITLDKNIQACASDIKVLNERLNNAITKINELIEDDKDLDTRVTALEKGSVAQK